MKSLLNENIDYSLFKKYDKDYFKKSLIVPIYEDNMAISFAVCKESNLIDVNDIFFKILKFKEYEKDEVSFLLSHLDTKLELFELAYKSLFQDSTTEKGIAGFIYNLLEFAINLRVSDIHFEDYNDLVLIRFRIDGKLKTFFSFDIKLLSIISSYLKLISNLDITQIRLPLDSRFSLKFKDINFDFRISTMPTVNSESIVLRVLDTKYINRTLDSLGFTNSLYLQIKEALKLTQGLILIAGPTGSGKTTTLYSMLNELKSNERKIITVEDPVEYKIDSISQVQVNSKVGLDFDLVLRNILRQDPDIIFIGEIRDKFSLDIALQASLTGHLVLASIHANSALETITRLFDLSADEFLISTTLKMILSQRLVLKYCENCNAKGCEKCNYSSYYDRETIAEVLRIDDILSSMIFKRSKLSKFKEYLKSIEFNTILEDGKIKVDNNITSLEEVYKAINS